MHEFIQTCTRAGATSPTGAGTLATWGSTQCSMARWPLGDVNFAVRRRSSERSDRSRDSFESASSRGVCLAAPAMWHDARRAVRSAFAQGRLRARTLLQSPPERAFSGFAGKPWRTGVPVRGSTTRHVSWCIACLRTTRGRSPSKFSGIQLAPGPLAA